MINGFWMSGNDYRKQLYRQAEFMQVSPLIEIAVELHEIAKQLAELNNHLPPLEEEQ